VNQRQSQKHSLKLLVFLTCYVTNFIVTTHVMSTCGRALAYH